MSEITLIEKELINQVLPELEKEFFLAKKSIAGLSKGSYQAFKIGTDYPEVFSKVEMFSPALYSNVIEDKFAKIKTENFSKQKFFLSIGSLENERFINFKTILEKEFRERKIPLKSYISPETYHEWLTWHRSLYNFLLWQK